MSPSGMTAGIKLGGIDSEGWLTDTNSRIADHPACRIAELLPWNYRPT